MSRSFYDTDEWRTVRYRVLRRDSGHCALCGTRGGPSNPLQVDHIKPRSKFPNLQYDMNNLQVLCRDCNLGKSNKDQTNWRLPRQNQKSVAATFLEVGEKVGYARGWNAHQQNLYKLVAPYLPPGMASFDKIEDTF